MHLFDIKNPVRKNHWKNKKRGAPFKDSEQTDNTQLDHTKRYCTNHLALIGHTLVDESQPDSLKHLEIQNKNIIHHVWATRRPTKNNNKKVHHGWGQEDPPKYTNNLILGSPNARTSLKYDWAAIHFSEEARLRLMNKNTRPTTNKEEITPTSPLNRDYKQRDNQRC